MNCTYFNTYNNMYLSNGISNECIIMNTLNTLSALLLEVRNNPELNSAVMRQCEDLYSEMFIASEFKTGSEILELNNFCRETKDELCRQLFNHELNKIHTIKRAKEQLEMDALYPDEPEINYLDDDEDNNDWDPNDEYSPSVFDYDENAYAEWDEDAYQENIERLRGEIMTTKFGYLVNYKGECEGECIIDEDSKMRTFHGKYDYA